ETIVRSRREGRHYRVDIETDNEFGQLARAFNELQEANGAALTKLATLASQDALTGLPNRRGLNEKLKQLSQSRISDVLGEARGDARGNVAVHFIDLDDFKAINDTFGHETGDKFLVHVAEQLRGVIGSDDWIARLGGDEFIVVQRDIANEEEARVLAQRLMAALSVPFVIHDKKIAARASIGIALGCGASGDLTQLPALADIALYHSKERGTGTVSVLNPALLLAHSRARELEIALPQAFAERQIEVWYQAQFDARTGAVCGLEALARWRHPVHGYISPVEFVPLIEKTGHSGRLARVVLEDACIRAQQMRRLGYSDFRIAVNLSPSELADTCFVETLKALTRAYDVAPTTLEIEITEGTLINSVADTAAVIGALRAMGVSVALDDFGTGYSSLAYLRRFPIDKIKIDKAFVRNIAQDADDEAVVEMIAVLAGKLGFKVVAEGIEEPAQLQALRAIGVDMGQGFLFHRPQPFADLEQFLLAQAAARELPLRASA
ncbi:MAG: EAL domain-containing protein, partial [Hyphomicrobiales bacterium]